jgi:hypothetical protein
MPATEDSGSQANGQTNQPLQWKTTDGARCNRGHSFLPDDLSSRCGGYKNEIEQKIEQRDETGSEPKRTRDVAFGIPYFGSDVHGRIEPGVTERNPHHGFREYEHLHPGCRSSLVWCWREGFPGPRMAGKLRPGPAQKHSKDCQLHQNHSVLQTGRCANDKGVPKPKQCDDQCGSEFFREPVRAVTIEEVGFKSECCHSDGAAETGCQRNPARQKTDGWMQTPTEIQVLAARHWKPPRKFPVGHSTRNGNDTANGPGSKNTSRGSESCNGETGGREHTSSDHAGDDHAGEREQSETRGAGW